MTEDGMIHNVSIYHNGGSGDMLLAVYTDDNSLPD
jgi:L-aminopeptidase/D-esterase-like protein